MRRLPNRNIRKGLFHNFYKDIIRINKLNRKHIGRYIFYDIKTNRNNWKYGFFTDGKNNISLSRKKYYQKPVYPFRSFGRRRRLGYKNFNGYIGSDVRKILRKFRK